MRCLFLIFMVFLFLSSAYGQNEPPRGRKPVLIRDDPNEKKPEEQEMVVQPNPKLAAESITVGDFYFRRDNYKAAAERYREAVKYNSKSAEAYEKLIKSLEKQKAFQEALTVCEQFVAANPSSKDTPRFQERASEMKSKVGQPPPVKPGKDTGPTIHPPG